MRRSRWAWPVLAAGWAVSQAAADPAPDNRDLKLNPADGPGTPAYERRLDERNLQRLEESLETGDSHLDVVTPVASGEERDAVTPPEVGAPAKIETEAVPEAQPAGHAPAPAVQPVETVRAEDVAAVLPEGDAGGAGIDAIVAALIEAMNRAPDIRRVSYDSREGAEERSAAAVPSAPAVRPLPSVRAGDAFYGRLLHTVNSDYPGPVLIEILQPPLAGAVARGEFRLVRERMVIRLAVLQVADEAVEIDAVAVGLDCGCFGVTGDVSYHWWERVLLPAATGFLEQYLIARAEPERRVVTGAGGTVATDQRERSARQARDAGLAAVAGRVGDVLLEQAPSVRTVSIPRNAELAVMFAETLARRRSRAPEESVEAQRPSPPPVERVGARADDGSR